MKKQIVFTFILTIISTFGLGAQEQLTEHKTEILGWLDEFDVPAVGIGIVKEGNVLEYHVFGNLRKNIPAPDNSIFTVASLTKPLVSMVTLKLVEAGQWDLDEPLYKYWIDPDIADDNRHKIITTRQILSHQSGLPNWRTDLESKKLEFLFEPGEKYNYSGEGYEYLGKALENKFQKSIEQLSDSVLFEPLKMKDTKYRWNGEIDEYRYAYRHKTKEKEYKYQRGTKASAAGGALTSIEDYLKFTVDVLHQAGLSNELYNEMISKQQNIKSNVDQGLGWELISNLPNNEYALVHEGGSEGVRTIVVLLPVSEQSIVVFTNGDEGHKVYSKIIEEYFDFGKDILKALSSMSYDPNQLKTVNVSKDILSEYTGSYLIKSFQMNAEIILENNMLKMKAPQNTVDLYSKSETEFFAKADDLIIEFVVGENKNISGFMMTFRGAKPEFSKRTE